MRSQPPPPHRARSFPAFRILLLAGLEFAAASCTAPPDDRVPPPPPAPGDPIVESLAAEGETLFRTKGCLACHKIGGGDVVGPDLAGVTDRRDWVWFRGMVANPDSMLLFDPIAQELLGRYRSRMVPQPLSPYQVRALYEHLRRFPD